MHVLWVLCWESGSLHLSNQLLQEIKWLNSFISMSFTSGQRLLIHWCFKKWKDSSLLRNRLEQAWFIEAKSVEFWRAKLQWYIRLTADWKHHTIAAILEMIWPPHLAFLVWPLLNQLKSFLLSCSAAQFPSSKTLAMWTKCSLPVWYITPTCWWYN